MSYSRFASEEAVKKYGVPRSDVYIFEHVDGYMNCAACLLVKDFRATEVQDMLDHLDEHEAAGHIIPPDLRECLVEDWPGEDGWQ